MLLDINNISESDRIEDVVEAFVAQGHEGAFWDFKRVWPSNGDLIHDIACMANNLETDTSYIICGIDDENGFKTVDVATTGQRKNTQQLNNLLWSQPWAFEPPVVEVAEASMADGLVDVIVIRSKQESQPYYLTEEIMKQGTKLRAGAIYTRVKDSNTPINRTASLRDTEMLWRRRFGLDLTPLERFPFLLSEKEMWVETSPHPAYETEAFTETYYHKMFPEFTFMMIPDDERDGWEYYMLVSPFNKKPDWYKTRFYYRSTLLTESLGVYIDHHFFPVPKFSVFPDADDASYSDRKFYYYYIEGSLNDRIEQFCLSRESPGSHASHRFIMEVIPRYKSEAEKLEFEEFVTDNQDMLLREKNSANVFMEQPEVVPSSYREDYLEVFREQAEYGAALVKLLEHFRHRAMKAVE